MRDPRPISELLEDLLRKLGAGDLDTWRVIETEWPSIAGPPWDRHARPLSLHDGILVVEATAPSAIAILRYGVAGLRARLAERVGAEAVIEVKVRAARLP